MEDKRENDNTKPSLGIDYFICSMNKLLRKMVSLFLGPLPLIVYCDSRATIAYIKNLKYYEKNIY